MTDATVKVALKDATRKQLREFATERFGIPLANFDHSKVIIAKLQQAGWDKDYIEVRDDSAALRAPGAPSEAPAPAKPVDIDARDNEWFEIVIPVSDAPGGGEPVFVSVNGVGQYIERGKSQWVRRPYIEALEHAKQTLYRQEPDMKTPPEPYEALTYPFQIVKRGLSYDQVAPLIKAYQEERAARR